MTIKNFINIATPFVLGIIIGVGLTYFAFYFSLEQKSISLKEEINSFEECVSKGYSVLESFPRQCKTPDGRVFTEKSIAPKSCIKDTDCIVFGTPEDSNCGCFNKDYQWESFNKYKDVCVVPSSCLCKNGECVDFFDATNWNFYENKEYGFRMKYPSAIKENQIHFWEKDKFLGEPNLYGLSFSLYCYSGAGERVLYSSFIVKVDANADNLLLKDWIQKYEYCGPRKGEELDIGKLNLEEFYLHGYEGMKIKNLGGCPPGGGGVDEIAYISKDSMIYKISAVSEILSEEFRENCLERESNIFNQILSTFEFI